MAGDQAGFGPAGLD